MSTRLKRYRAFNDRLRLTTSVSALKQGLYVKRPGITAAEQIVGHMEPSPTSHICLVGGIGSGKTTELLLATERLAAVEDTRAFYMDVSELHDLEALEPGVLITAVGLQLCTALGGLGEWRPGSLPTPLESLVLNFRRWAETQERDVVDPAYVRANQPYDDDDMEPTIRQVVSGKLSMPKRIERDLEWMLPILGQLRAALPKPNQYLVVLLDSLDRVNDMEAFATAMDADLRLLARAGIGAVLTAPLLSLYGKHRPILERFDHIVHLPPADTENPEELNFLTGVLAARDPDGVLPAEVRAMVARLSGGVLRDMLALAKDAAQQAYMAGADTIGMEHVRAALFQLGRTRWLGLNGNEIKILRRVMTTPLGQFAPRTDTELALVMTRRILEYPQLGKEPRFTIHPALVPLLAGISEVPE